MENTCKEKDCWFYLLIKDLGKSESLDFNNCPFYVEMLWTPNSINGKVESAKIIKDCSNKRSLMTLLEDVNPRLTGVQESNEQMRNQASVAAETFFKLLKLSSAEIKKEPIIEIPAKGD